jgi:hypothetical protein
VPHHDLDALAFVDERCALGPIADRDGLGMPGSTGVENLTPCLRSQRRPTEANLIAVGVAIRHLPHPIRVGLPLG